MALSSPFMFKYARHLEAQGQAYDTYRWYLPASAGNCEFGSCEMKLRNTEAVLTNAPDSEVSSSADRAIWLRAEEWIPAEIGTSKILSNCWSSTSKKRCVH